MDIHPSLSKMRFRNDNRKGIINPNFKNIHYQIGLSLQAIIKYSQNPKYSDFLVNTEVKKVEPFKDIIAEMNGSYQFFLCLHKETPSILRFNDFFRKNSNLDLRKYFTCYVQIKEEHRNTKDFIISTNHLLRGSDQNQVTLMKANGTAQITFVKVGTKDEVFGVYGKRFKFFHDRETRETIKKSLDLEELETKFPGMTTNVKFLDKKIDGFLRDLMFVFEYGKRKIDIEVSDFIRDHFKLTQIASQNSCVMLGFYDWLEQFNVPNPKLSVDKQTFKSFLVDIYERSRIIPNVIDRTMDFPPINFVFQLHENVINFVNDKLKSDGSEDQLLYMQMEEGDTFYGTAMIKQELKTKTSDVFLILSTSHSTDSAIEEGLRIFSMGNCFEYLILVEDKENPIQDELKEKIKAILEENDKKSEESPSKMSPKRVLIITDRDRSEFTEDIKENDENLLTIPKVKLANLSPKSLESFLKERELKLQDEDVNLESILDASDQSMIEELKLRDLEEILSISHNVIDGKNFDPNSYIDRKLLQRNIIRKEILSDIKEGEKIVADETTFETFCRRFPNANVHLLEPQYYGNHLVWKQTKGRIDFLFDYINSEQGTPVEDPWIAPVSADKVFVLSEVAGMGKTYWSYHLTQELKKKFKDHMIIHTSLNDHIEYFKDHTFENDDCVLEFLEREVLKLQSDTENQIFRAACKQTKKVKVIFDGLDEIHLEYETEIFKMIQILCKMDISGVFVSTRPGSKRKLEKMIQNFYHEFVPLPEEDQQKLLTKYWSKKMPDKFSDENLHAVAKKVILVVKEKELTGITGIPLIMRMVADIFDSDLILEATENGSVVEEMIFNLSELYEEFVDKNIERYLTDRNKMVELIPLYKKMALKLILPQHLELFNENFEFDSDELEQMRECGLILSDSKGNFMHRTITEYLVHSTIEEKFSDEKIAEFVIQDIFCGDEFKVIRYFLNSSIKKCSCCMKVYGKILLESEDNCKKSVQIACEEKNANILEFLFESLFVMKSETTNDFLSEIIDSKFFKLYVRNINDNFKVFNRVERKSRLRSLRNFLLKDDFEALRISAQNPVNCQCLLSIIKRKFNDTDFWDPFQGYANNFISALLKQKIHKENLNRILNELCEIESNNNIVCIETFPVFSSKRYKSEPVVNFLSFLIKVKGFEIFMKVFFINEKEIFNYHLLNACLVELKLLDEFRKEPKLFNSIMKIAFQQLLGRSTCEVEETRQTLMSEKLKTDFTDEELKELQNLPEIFEFADDKVEFILEFALLCFGYLYLELNCKDPEIIQIFFRDLLESDNFNGMLEKFFYNLTEVHYCFGRFLFDHLDFKISESENLLMTVEDFSVKLKDKQSKGFNEEAFLYFLMRSTICSINSKEDRKKLILLFELISESTQHDGTVFNFSKIYEKFVDTNIERYLIEKLELDLSERGYQKIANAKRLELINLYKQMALKLIIPEHLELFSGNFGFTSKDLKDMRECGLIVSGSEVKFIHSSIADYFVYSAIQEKFYDENIAEFVVRDISFEDDFEVIRCFLNSSIDKLESVSEIHGNILINSIEECKKSLEIACIDQNVNILEFLLDSLFALKPDLEFVQEIFDWSFLELYLKNINGNLKIFELIERELGLEVLRNCLMSEDFDVLRISAEIPDNYELLISTMKEKFDDEEFLERFDPILDEEMDED